MTVVAYRDGVLAADTLVTSNGGGTRRAETVKIVKRGEVLGAAVGEFMASRRFLDWVRSGLEGDCPDLGEGESDAHGYIFHRGRILTFTPKGRNTLDAPFWAAGSGFEFAMGAMAAGATPREAVVIAMQFDTGCGGRVQELRA